MPLPWFCQDVATTDEDSECAAQNSNEQEEEDDYEDEEDEEAEDNDSPARTERATEKLRNDKSKRVNHNAQLSARSMEPVGGTVAKARGAKVNTKIHQVSWSHLSLSFLYFVQQASPATMSKEACVNLQPKAECELDSRDTQARVISALDRISAQNIWRANKFNEVISFRIRDTESMCTFLAKAIEASSGDAEDATLLAQLCMYTYSKDKDVTKALVTLHE